MFPETLSTTTTTGHLGAGVRDIYLSLAFWTATAFSPTDVSAIKRWAKLLMMIEAMVSLGIGVLVVARAVNILKKEQEIQPAGPAPSIPPPRRQCERCT